MLGDSLLVAPVFNAEGDTAYYVPEGRWTKLLTGETVDGPRWVKERHGFDSVPLLVRPGSVIATGSRDDRPDYSYVDGVTLNLFALPDGVLETSVPALDGSPAATYRITRTGDELRVSAVEGTGERELLTLHLKDEQDEASHAGFQLRVHC